MFRLGVVSLACVIGCATNSPQPKSQVEDPGPRSGLAEDTMIRSLGAADQALLCTWWGDTLGDGRVQHCTDCQAGGCTEWDVAVSTQADCVAWLTGLTCNATVRDAEDCAFAQEPDLCASVAACRVLDGC